MPVSGAGTRGARRLHSGKRVIARKKVAVVLLVPVFVPAAPSRGARWLHAGKHHDWQEASRCRVPARLCARGTR